ncbi:MAG: DNA-processing protein DprA [Legionellales bacterium]|nr:DNA-processing protein DprA [Legionellales bacterium]
MENNRLSLDYWLALHHIPGCGIATVKKLLAAVDNNVEQIFTLRDPELTALGIPISIRAQIQRPDWQKVDEALNWARETHSHLVAFADPNYPPLLKQINAAPLILYAQGLVECLTKPQLAIVGSRQPSQHGISIAHNFAKQLSQQGLIITSGLAAGIDTASHFGAINHHYPTIAVMGTGLNHIFPEKNRNLAAKIREQGVLISEFTPQTPPRAENFPRRNRIISGMCVGVLVVEAALRSGSLITARYANEQGREVFAVPGSINNPLSQGCHELIRQGAKLVSNINDILVELGMLLQTTLTIEDEKLITVQDPQQQKILDLLHYESLSVDHIVAHSGLESDNVVRILQSLELDGLIQSNPHGYERILR